MKQKSKEIKLPMKFDAGKQKYEPELPVIKKGKKVKFKDFWMLILMILIAVALSFGAWLFAN